jgi:hypothetical protein
MSLAGSRAPDPAQSPSTTADTLALERLAAGLDTREYATILTGGALATLRVVSRRAPGRAEDIHTGDGWFCGAAAGLLAPCRDIPAAALAVARAVSGRVR